VREEEEGRELLVEGELNGIVDRVEGREVRSYRGAPAIISRVSKKTFFPSGLTLTQVTEGGRHHQGQQPQGNWDF